MTPRAVAHPTGRRALRTALAACVGAVLLVTASACDPQGGTRRPHIAMFIGIDSSGSFRASGDYENALSFLAHYIYGHLHELGGLAKPRELFVGSIGGRQSDEPKAFHPIHDFTDKTVAEIEAGLREWFPPTDTMTDFNVFFQQVARVTKERNLALAPITVVMLSDGIPDAGGRPTADDPAARYRLIDLSPLEYLSRNLTVRLAYASPKVGDQWRKHVPRRRVRMWTVDAEVMRGWTTQVRPETEIGRQDHLWKWVLDNVDYRVRSVLT